MPPPDNHLLLSLSRDHGHGLFPKQGEILVSEVIRVDGARSPLLTWLVVCIPGLMP